MGKDEFLTIAKPSESLLVVKKSKFIVNVIPVKDVTETEGHIEDYRKKYWDATHNVYAYVLGLNNVVQKFSDDGEPTGTAGRPVLEVIKSKEIKDVLIVVTRYFGGILLGAGGLVRAYSESALVGINNSDIVKKVNADIYSIVIDYNFAERLQWRLNDENIVVKDIDYGEKVTMKIYVPTSRKLDLEQYILNITLGNAIIKYLGKEYIYRPYGKNKQ